MAGHPPLPNKRRGRQVSTSFVLVEGQTTLKSLTILCLNKAHSKHAFSVPRLWNLKWAPYRYHKHIVIKELLNVTCIKAERREIQHQRLKPSRVSVCWLKLQSGWNQAPSPLLEEKTLFCRVLFQGVFIKQLVTLFWQFRASISVFWSQSLLVLNLRREPLSENPSLIGSLALSVWMALENSPVRSHLRHRTGLGSLSALTAQRTRTVRPICHATASILFIQRVHRLRSEIWLPLGYLQFPLYLYIP